MLECKECKRKLCNKCSGKTYEVTTYYRESVHKGFGNYETYNDLQIYGDRVCQDCMITLIENDELYFVKKKPTSIF